MYICENDRSFGNHNIGSHLNIDVGLHQCTKWARCHVSAILWLFKLFICSLIIPLFAAPPAVQSSVTSLVNGMSECVILLHGLARSSASMEKMQSVLESSGFVVVNVDYPSREYAIERLAEIAISEGIDHCKAYKAGPIHFVTHSLGGILVRIFVEKNEQVKIHRVVMLGPPNQGSEVVDALENVPLFDWVNGPAGLQLGTDLSDIPKSLGPVNFELGVIAGTRTVNPILSTMLPKPNDGKVSVDSTKVSGMSDFIVLPTTHTFMMRNDLVIQQTVHFLKQGVFDHE